MSGEANYQKVKEALPHWKPEQKPGLYHNNHQKFSVIDVIAIARCGFLEARMIFKRLREEGELA